MRRSSLGPLFVLLLSASACGIDPKEQLVTHDASEPPRTATRDWAGEAITIRNAGIDDGINARTELGGVEVHVSPAATRVSVEAVFGAHADDDRPENAEQSISDAKKALIITETATSFDVACGHGGTHGTSRAAGSGCKVLRVTIPAGSAAQPHTLAVESGSGFVRVGVVDIPHVRALRVDHNGVDSVEVRVRPVKDATLTIAGENAVRLALPGDFSARSVVFALAQASFAEIVPSFVTSDFPGMASGSSYPASGPSADAIRELTIASRGPLAADMLRITRF